MNMKMRCEKQRLAANGGDWLHRVQRKTNNTSYKSIAQIYVSSSDKMGIIVRHLKMTTIML